MKFQAFARHGLLLTGLWLSCAAVAFAQPGKKGTSPDDCRLDEAKRWYEEGNLERIEEIEACVKDPKSMSSEKRIEALELLTESYLYRNELDRADRSFRELLRIDPLYETDSVGESYESYDMIYLSNTFTRRPIFSMYFGAGTNFTLVEMLQNYGMDNTSGVSDKESYLDRKVFGGNAQVGFELPLLWGFDLALDATFGYRAYAFDDSMYISVNEANPSGQSGEINELNTTSTILYSTLAFREDQFWIDVPIMLRYNIEKFHGFLPYVYVGGAANFLLHAQLTNIERTTVTEGPQWGGKNTPVGVVNLTNVNSFVTDNTVSMRTRVNWSLVAGAGVKFRIGRNFLYADFRYTRMFLNAVDINNRYASRRLAFNYAHVDNDFRMDNFAINIGFVKAFYMPRKKRTYNPLVIDGKYNRFLERERNYIKRETDEDLKRELNSAIKDMERMKPSLIEDVQKGRREGMELIKDKQQEIEDIKNKRVKVEIKYE